MKFLDAKGREHTVDIRPSKWKVKEVGSGRGKFQSEVGILLKQKYPLDHILEEFPCVGEKLYLDFFIPRKMLAIEVQGTQHTSYNKFFHASRADFLSQQTRDKRKEHWCKINSIELIKISYGESEENIKKLLG